MSEEPKGVIGPIYAAPIQSCETAVVPWAKPIRLYQLKLLTGLLFLITWRIVAEETAYGPAEGAATLALVGAFLLVSLVDVISQCGSEPIPDTPMFLFGVLGSILFFMAAGNMYLVSKKDNLTGIVKLLISMVLSVTCAILFLVDITLIFLYGY